MASNNQQISAQLLKLLMIVNCITTTTKLTVQFLNVQFIWQILVAQNHWSLYCQHHITTQSIKTYYVMA